MRWVFRVTHVLTHNVLLSKGSADFNRLATLGLVVCYRRGLSAVVAFPGARMARTNSKPLARKAGCYTNQLQITKRPSFRAQRGISLRWYEPAYANCQCPAAAVTMPRSACALANPDATSCKHREGAWSNVRFLCCCTRNRATARRPPVRLRQHTAISPERIQ